MPVKKRVPLEGAELEEFYRRSRQPSDEHMDEGRAENAGSGREGRKRKRRRLLARGETADAGVIGVVGESDESSSSASDDESDDEQPETAAGVAVEASEQDVKDTKPQTQAQAALQQPDSVSSRPHRTPHRLSSITGAAQLPFDLPAANSRIPIPLARAEAVRDNRTCCFQISMHAIATEG